jgi:hypothetical protein
MLLDVLIIISIDLDVPGEKPKIDLFKYTRSGLKNSSVTPE